MPPPHHWRLLFSLVRVVVLTVAVVLLRIDRGEGPKALLPPCLGLICHSIEGTEGRFLMTFRLVVAVLLLKLCRDIGIAGV